MLRLASLASFSLSLSCLLLPASAARADEPSPAPSAEAAPAATGAAVPGEALPAAPPVPGDDELPAAALEPAARIDEPFTDPAAVAVPEARPLESLRPSRSDADTLDASPIATRNRARITPIPNHAPPPGYVLATANRRGVWGGGIGVAGGTYVLSTGMAAILAAGYGDSSILARGCLPILGSFLMAGEDPSGFVIGTGIALGVGQLAGLSMILGGSIARRQVWLREDLARPNLLVSAGPSGGSLTVEF